MMVKSYTMSTRHIFLFCTHISSTYYTNENKWKIKFTCVNLNRANAAAEFLANAPPSIEYICVLKHASPKPNKNEHANAIHADGGLRKPIDFVSSNGASSGKFKKIKRKLKR